MIPKIKLIACDIDGTLIFENQKEINPQVFKEIKRLYKKGIMFCPASGRQYTSLKRLFEPVKDEIYYICENGAVIYAPGKHGKIISKTAMPRKNAEKLIKNILAAEGAEVLISGGDISYIIPKSNDYPDYIQKNVGNNIKIIKDPCEINEDIIKISVYSAMGDKYFLDSFSGDYCTFSPVVSGTKWLDFTIADKGTGIRAISREENFPLGDIMAIGDNYNDLPMFDIIGHPFIMENADNKLKSKYKNHCIKVEDTLSML